MATEAVVREIEFGSLGEMASLFGNMDEHVFVLESEFHVKIDVRETKVLVSGLEENVAKTQAVISKLISLIGSGENIDRSRVRYAISLAQEGQTELIDLVASDVVALTYKGRPVRCKTLGQKQYVQAMRQNTVVFSVGPAGTGKTYLAMAMAVSAYKNKEISRIILTRPAVEAGEKLGFLPGDLQQKVDPYLRPLYDALYEFLGNESYEKLAERGVIEVAPLAYMRGRTLNDAYIILDEAQNTTPAQMKMFITRFGAGSKVVVTGDITQIDLPHDQKSGLIEVIEILKDIKGIAVARLSEKDVVRHELVQEIIRAYEKHDKKRGDKR